MSTLQKLPWKVARARMTACACSKLGIWWRSRHLNPDSWRSSRRRMPFSVRLQGHQQRRQKYRWQQFGWKRSSS